MRIGSRRHHHGFNLPLFWLKSPNSCGIGDFSDLKLLIDWCALINWQIIQLLPLCDTWDETSPYSAISATSLNWIYVDISDMLCESERSEARALNELNYVAYSRVRAFKRSVIERKCDEGAFISEALLFAQDHPWVAPYARFCSLKETFGSTAWWTWPPLDEQSPCFQRRYRFFITAQHLAFWQLRSAKEYAEKYSVKIMGDLPILMSRDSCDVWRHPDWFDVTQEVGAPPDQYAPNGQNWGFPPYKWGEIQRSDYSWWRERLNAADQYFHLYRLDHIAGFFRLWCIPLNEEGKRGSYFPRTAEEMEHLGRANLRAISSAGRALAIGEDLGAISPIIRQVMSELGIPGTKVMRWERTWQKGAAFTPMSQYPFCSMTTVSTHDSQTLSQWWRDQPDESSLLAETMKSRWNQELNVDQRLEILRQSHTSNSSLHINLLLEYLALFPEIAPGIADQRINVPGTISKSNWTCRCPVDFHIIAKHIGLLEVMRSLAN